MFYYEKEPNGRCQRCGTMVTGDRIYCNICFKIISAEKSKEREEEEQIKIFNNIKDLRRNCRNLECIFQNDFTRCIADGIYNLEYILSMKKEFNEEIEKLKEKIENIKKKGMKILIKQIEKNN